MTGAFGTGQQQLASVQQATAWQRRAPRTLDWDTLPLCSWLLLMHHQGQLRPRTAQVCRPVALRSFACAACSYCLLECAVLPGMGMCSCPSVC